MSSEDHESSRPAWQPIGTVERRVLGVLVEKAKTTPDAYPLTLNSLTTGANQKSNRSPLMQLDPIDVENALDNLRRLGAVTEIMGSGRASKYRHHLYEWMGVDKLEAAVITELLLRGEQTVGELRGRAARMGKIEGLAELKPILQSLMNKGLVQALTPEGRGQVVTHCLYLPEQQEKLVRNHGSSTASSPADRAPVPNPPNVAAPDRSVAAEPDDSNLSPPAEPLRNHSGNELAELATEVESLKQTVADLEKRLEILEQFIN